MQSYVLVAACTGCAQDVVRGAQVLKQVHDAQLVLSGRYDIVIEVDTQTYAELETLIDEVRHLPGVEGVAACEGFQPGPGFAVGASRRS